MASGLQALRHAGLVTVEVSASFQNSPCLFFQHFCRHWLAFDEARCAATSSLFIVQACKPHRSFWHDTQPLSNSRSPKLPGCSKERVDFQQLVCGCVCCVELVAALPAQGMLKQMTDCELTPAPDIAAFRDVAGRSPNPFRHLKVMYPKVP